MTDLTEQYLNGNLHDGDEYYIENKDGEISTMHLYNDTMHWHSFKVKKLKVLAPVPSYDEYWHMISCLNDQTEILNEKVELKELLEECRPYINNSATSRMIKNSAGHKKDMKLLTKIDEVL